MYTDEKEQYRRALDEDPFTCRLKVTDSFSHTTINSKEPRTVMNELFSVNYLDREVRKDVPEYRRETVCVTFRNQCNRAQSHNSATSAVSE